VSEREDLAFASGDDTCAAWLYRPDGVAGPAPCVVMAHGFSATREDTLPSYAERFAAAGMAVLLFDYRHFGDSTGTPRQLLDIGRQQADYHAAVAFARTLDGIDAQRVGLFGTSFSGGHVVAVAAQDPSVACPLLVCVCERDSTTPPGAAIKMGERAPHGEVLRYPVGHFEIYVGEPFERAVADQTAFLQRHLVRAVTAAAVV
jgi:fermentation-respiration switch protein FrsA (DUF1100 family)